MRNILCSSFRGKAKPLMMLGGKGGLLGPEGHGQAQCTCFPCLTLSRAVGPRPTPHLPRISRSSAIPL